MISSIRSITSAKSGIATDLIDDIISDLKRQGVPDEEAESKAETIAAERAETIVARHIRPAVEFIADRANLFAVRPLLMVDVAGLDARAPFDNRTRYGVGGGVQLTIVVAKLEVGYMHAVRRLAGDPAGRFMFRVIFDNLF